MTYNGTITIMDMDIAAAAAGIRTMFPTLRHVVFARSAHDVEELSAYFRNQFAIDLQQDYFATRIGERLGLFLRSFVDGHEQVGAQANVVHAGDMLEASRHFPELLAVSRPALGGNRGPIR
jgi:hypothetical protein